MSVIFIISHCILTFERKYVGCLTECILYGVLTTNDYN